MISELGFLSPEVSAIVAAACHRTLINAIEKYALFRQVNVAADLTVLSRANDELEKKYCGD